MLSHTLIPRSVLEHGGTMRSSTATFAVLGAALVCAFALSAAGADAAESDSMSKYRKRTGQKFLAEKEKEALNPTTLNPKP